MANTAENLMGRENPNLPEELEVRREELRQIRMQRTELESEIAELRCASRELNDRLVKQAMFLDAERKVRLDLEGLVARARQIMRIAHFRRYPTHERMRPADVKRVSNCATCIVLRDLEGGAR